MAIATNVSRVHAALQFKSQEPFYVSLGRPEPWEDDPNPPKEDGSITQMESLIGFKKAKRISLARESYVEEPDYESITYKRQNYALIPDEDAYAQNARYVYLEIQIMNDDFPQGEFRQVGLHTNVKPNEGKAILLPEEVTDQGFLQFVTNRRPQKRNQNVDITIRYLINFTNDKQLSEQIETPS